MIQSDWNKENEKLMSQIANCLTFFDRTDEDCLKMIMVLIHEWSKEKNKNKKET